MMFHLSKRQQKELANGKQLRIALPHPVDDPENYLTWARAHLDCDPQWIVSAVADSFPCVRIQSTGDVALEIGHIVRGEEYRDKLQYYVEVVLCDLTQRDRPRGKYPPQWPGSYSV